MLSSRRFVQKVGEMAFFFVGDATQAHGDWLARLKILDGPKHAFLPRNGTNGHEQPRSVPSGSTRSNRVKTRPDTRSCCSSIANADDVPRDARFLTGCQVGEARQHGRGRP